MTQRVFLFFYLSDPNSQMEFVNPAFNIADTEFTLVDR